MTVENPSGPISESAARQSFDAPPTPNEQSAAAFREIAAKYGLSPEATEATLGKHGIKLTQAPANTPPKPGDETERPANPSNIGTLSGDKVPTEFSEAEVGNALELLYEHWTGPKEDLIALAAKYGFAPATEIADEPQPLELQRFETLHDAAKPNEYDFGKSYVDRPEIAGADLPAFDGAVRQAFSVAGISKIGGPLLLQAMLDSGREFAAQKPGASRQAWSQEQIKIAGRGLTDPMLAKEYALYALTQVPEKTRLDWYAKGYLSSATAIRFWAEAGELRLIHEQLLERAKK